MRAITYHLLLFSVEILNLRVAKLNFRMKASQEMPENTSTLHRFINEVAPTVTLLEVTSLALFAIITSHTDSDRKERYLSQQ